MQDPKFTTAPNAYYDLVSVLYHTLQQAQTCTAYAHDAQQAGNAELAHFFHEVHQNMNQIAEKAQYQIEKWNTGRIQRSGYQGNYPSGMQSSQH
jgi:hypothetical protein